MGIYIRELLFTLCSVKTVLITLKTKDREAHIQARRYLVEIINKEGCEEKIAILAILC